MSEVVTILIIAFVIINVIFMLTYFSEPLENNPQTPAISNKKTQESSQKVPSQISQNESLNLSLIYESNCINSTKRHAESLENITNLTTIETKIFDKENDVIDYLERNWPSIFYDIKGMKKDITKKTVVSIFDIRTNRGRNFTLPVLCDESGKIGNYSSCLLSNIPNIPSICHNFTINLTECETEWSEHHILDDIQYWITPPGGGFIIGSASTVNKTQIFNFTILSSRKRLESFGMSIIERTFSPLNDDEIFSSTKLTPDGRGGSIIKEINITGRKSVEFYVTIWFKKKCYDKYMIY